jgi:hypothetical protein
VVDLHALLPPEFSAGGSIAYDIDTAGNIVGLAQRPDGSTVGVLRRRTFVSQTPTPTPTADKRRAECADDESDQRAGS